MGMLARAMARGLLRGGPAHHFDQAAKGSGWRVLFRAAWPAKRLRPRGVKVIVSMLPLRSLIRNMA